MSNFIIVMIGDQSQVKSRTRTTRRVSLVEHELPTLPEHMRSSPVSIRVRVP